jgi:uncharacterized protein (TIGR02246 family)
MAHHEKIAALLEDWAAAEAGNDPTALEPLLTEDFTAVGPKGFVLDRRQWLERYQSQALRNAAFTLHEQAIRLHRDTALAIARQAQRASYQGHDASGEFRITVVAVQADDGWQIAGVHLSPIAAPTA